MKFIVAYDIRARANLCGLTKVLGEHRNLSNAVRVSDAGQLNKTNIPLA